MAIDLPKNEEDLNRRIEALKAEQEVKINRMFLHQRISLLVIGVLASAAWFYLTVIPENPGRTLMRFQEVVPLTPTQVCPGDELQYQLGLDVNRGGVFDYDVSYWRVSPPLTVIFSEPRRVVFTEGQTFVITRAWKVPEGYLDPLTLEYEKWLPGDYEMRFGLSTSSRSTEPSVTFLPFEIKEDCPK